MKNFMILFVIAGVFAMNTYAQSGSGSTPLAVETLLMIPKKGMEEKFEAAVLAHNKKFHPEGPYVAGLRKIEYGERSGWYVWVFGPTTYGSLDTRPTKENGHALDWTTNIDPLVEQYGAAGYWNYNTDLSYGLDIFKKSKHLETWGIDLKPKQYYRFKALVEKLRKVYESEGKTAFLVLENNLHGKDIPDVALVWSFDTYAAWQKDPGPKAAYEKMYGDGSWQTLLDEWMDMINDYSSEIRSIIR
ncbi:MAG: hypothetical protein Q8M08_13715 [Bacteroidales bacterium]|nr:hypothetical protein [Bacteroidales bacterium]